MRLFLLLFIGLSFLSQSKATTDSLLRYDNAIYEGDVRSVQFLNSSSGFNFPVVSLGTEIETLKLTFDQLTSERDYFQYTLIHCNADWTPSGLPRTLSVDGVGFENIDNASFSNGTLTQYVHYEVMLPTENTKPKVSGNYLLVVYRNFDEKDIILSRRMMVLSSKGAVNVNVSQSSQVEFRAQQQQVNFVFNKSSATYFIPNPYTDLRTVVLRNGEWKGAISDLKPQFIKGNSYEFNQMMGTQFDGLNEYRFFDMRSLQIAQAGVKKRANIANQKHIWLISDKPRGFDRYMNWRDYNGRILYDNKDLPEATRVESDYVFVHFSLMMPAIAEDVFLYGELSDWEIKEGFKMYYNTESSQYEAVVPLKQGYYNYLYCAVSSDGNTNFKPIEGSHSTAENNYMVLVYHRNQMLAYDELIGYGLVNSQPNR
jgi:hypothetical protein